MDAQSLMQRLPEQLQQFREEKLQTLRTPQEFFDMQRVSRPNDMGCIHPRLDLVRVRSNTKYFAGNYLLLVALLAVYSLLTNPLLLIALGFLVGGFAAINRFITSDVQFGQTVVTQKHCYTALFVIGLPILWFAAPIATFFWLVGSSAVLILGHAAMLEPGVESEYGSVQTV
ncbi:hypothetical protein JCM10212_003236 [Sporobolomyces blumeae]